jgi:DNA polymerase-3 subunit epsilon
LAQVYVELTGGRQIGLSLVAETLAATGLVAEDVRPAQRPVRPARPHAASVEELARHAQFVAALKEPLWLQLQSADPRAAH